MNKQNSIVTVVVATGVMNAGGTESLIMETFRHKSDRVRYILLVHHNSDNKSGIFDKEIRQIGIEVRYIGAIGELGVRRYVAAFRKVMAEIGHVDIVHSHLNASGGIIAMAAKKCGIRHRICHCHADIHYTGGIIARVKGELSLSVLKIMIDMYATGRWACSDAAWRRLYMPWRKKVVVNNMIDTRKYLATLDKRRQAKVRYGLEHNFVVGAVGRVAPIKNYECVLRAIVGTDAHFVCFGRFDTDNAYCRSLLELARQLDIEDHVHWMGNSDNVSDDIHCIDLFVMPSYTEGFGMAAIEAQAASIPSLLSTGVPEGVDVGLELAMFINPGSADEWHRAICDFHRESILEDDDVMEKFIAKGYDSPSAVKQIEDRYISLMSDR